MGYKVTRLQGYKVTRLQGYKVTRLQGYKVTGLQGYKVTGLQGYRVTRLQGYKVTGLQGYRVTRLQGYKVTGLVWATSATGSGGRQPVLEFAAGGGEVVRTKDGRHHTDALCARGYHLVNVFQRDAADGEPGEVEIRRGPTHIFECDRFGGRLGAGGKDRTNPQVIRAPGNRPSGLLRRGAAQANPELGRHRLTSARSRLSRLAGRRKLGNVGVARAEEILLTQMAELRPQLLREGKVIVNHQANASPLRHRQNRFRQLAQLVQRRFLGAQLNQVRAAVTKLLGDELGRAPAQVSGVHEGVKLAFL